MFDSNTVKEIASNARKPEFQSIADVQFAVVPDGFNLKSVKSLLDEYKTKPERRKGLINTFDLVSFVALTNRFKNVNSAIFLKATVGNNSFNAELRAVLNYHPAVDDNTAADNKDHTVHYGFPLSDELKTWLEKNKVGFSQKEFAEFLEDNIADLVVAKSDAFMTSFGENGVPSFATPSKVMELARGIDARVDEQVTQTYRVADGTFNLRYTTQNKDASGQPLNIPEWFCLGIPVFQNGKAYQIPLRLRFRLKEGAVTWFFELYRKNDVFQKAVDDVTTEAAGQTDLPLYNGTPE